MRITIRTSFALMAAIACCLAFNFTTRIVVTEQTRRVPIPGVGYWQTDNTSKRVGPVLYITRLAKRHLNWPAHRQMVERFFKRNAILNLSI